MGWRLTSPTETPGQKNHKNRGLETYCPYDDDMRISDSAKLVAIHGFTATLAKILTGCADVIDP